jgi:hypothetical protein
MNELITCLQRIQHDFQTLSKELDDVLREHAPNQQPDQSQQVILPARKRGRPKKEEAAAREAAKEIQKAEEAAKNLVVSIKPIKKIKKTIEQSPSVEVEQSSSLSPVKICRTCGIDLTLGADHRHCFVSSGFPSEHEWSQDCIAYAKEIGAGVAYAS